MLAAVILCALLIEGCGGASHFVSRVGSQLTLGGHEWRFIGFNDYELASVPGHTSCGRAIDDRTVNSVMLDAKRSGAAVIRTWFFQSYFDMSNASGSWRQIRPTWTAFDRILHAAAHHHLLVIPVLVNEFPGCEPAAGNKSIDFFSGGYIRPGFGYPLSFRRYATTLARHYAGNSTIAFWQLGNELESEGPHRCNERQSASVLRSFADDMTNAVKSADPHHLVSLGTIGYNQCGLLGADYARVHAGAVDLCEYHDYGVVTQSIPEGANSLGQRIRQCRMIHKPMFVGESGIPADTNDFGQSIGRISATSLQLRAGFFNAKITAAFEAGVVGYLIWDKRQDPSNSPLNSYFGRYEVGPSDPADQVTASLSKTFGAVPGVTRFGFEDGAVDRWRLISGKPAIAVSNSSEEAWSGTDSLKVGLRPSARPVIVATSATGGIGPGTTVTFRVYASSFAQQDLGAQLYLVSRLGDPKYLRSITLVPGWNVVQWRIPVGTRVPLRAVGLKIDDRIGFSGPLFLDDVSW